MSCWWGLTHVLAVCRSSGCQSSQSSGMITTGLSSWSKLCFEGSGIVQAVFAIGVCSVSSCAC